MIILNYDSVQSEKNASHSAHGSLSFLHDAKAAHKFDKKTQAEPSDCGLVSASDIHNTSIIMQANGFVSPFARGNGSAGSNAPINLRLRMEQDLSNNAQNKFAVKSKVLKSKKTPMSTIVGEVSNARQN